MRIDDFTVCATNYIEFLKEEGRYATAHVYKNALRSFTQFCGTPTVTFSQINRESLKQYAGYLLDNHLKLNTISTYMRMLRCIYNKGVELEQAKYIPHLFRDVYTGVDTRQKRALPVRELKTLLYKDPRSKSLQRTQAIACLLFQFCGMPFVDLAHLERGNLEDGLLKYNRIKTSTSMTVEVLDITIKAMHQLYGGSSLHIPGRPDYLFHILSGQYGRKEERGYIEYQSALRRFNNQLKRLAKRLHISSPVSSYTFRHSWATTAKHLGVPIEMISESLGHKSIKTTQIYLKGFELSEKTKVNRKNCMYVLNYGGKMSL